MANPKDTGLEPRIESAPVEPGSPTHPRLHDDPEKPADDAIPNQEAQSGVQKIEAITLSWSTLGLAALLIK